MVAVLAQLVKVETQLASILAELMEGEARLAVVFAQLAQVKGQLDVGSQLKVEAQGLVQHHQPREVSARD